MTAVASAPAKIILFGEHYGVFGEPAIVLAIDKHAYAQVEDTIKKAGGITFIARKSDEGVRLED